LSTWLSRLAETAEQEGTSLTQFVVSTLSKALGYKVAKDEFSKLFKGFVDAEKYRGLADKIKPRMAQPKFYR